MRFSMIPRHLTVFSLAMTGVVCLPAGSPAQTSLHRIQGLFHQPVFPKSPAPAQSPSGQSSSWFNDGLSGEEFLGLMAVLGLGVTSPLWVPAAAFDSGYNLDCHWPAYPYMGDRGRCAVTGDCQKSRLLEDDYWDNPLFLKGWSLRGSLDYGDDFAGLNQLGGELFLDTNFWRLGLLGHVNYFRESAWGATADALMTDANLTFRTVQNEWMFLHVGAGGRMWNSFNETHGGINALYWGDFFPINPLHITTLGEIGNLDKLLFLHVQGNIGFTWRHGEVFLGYDWTRISRVNLHGPTIGLRFWF